MEFTNSFIINYAEQLHQYIIKAELRFPAKVNYIIQKNYKKFLNIYEELMQARTEIFETYNTGRDEEGNYVFGDSEKLEQANKELNDLITMTQNIDMLQFDIDALGDQILTTQQMELLMYMIKDGEE